MYVHLVSSSKEKYDNLLSGILSTKLVFLLEKYNITMEELINDESHILNLHYKYPNIIIGINHYYVGGTDYLSLLLELYEATNVKFPKTNFLKSVYAIPSYLRIKPYLIKKEYPTLDKVAFYQSDYTKIIPKYKKAHIFHHLFSCIHTSLKLDRPMVIFITQPFVCCKGVNNNVGGYFLVYDSEDSISDIHKKIQDNIVQSYLTNSICHLPQRKSKSNFRYNIDCLLSCACVDSEFDFRTYLQLYGPPIEQVYCSCLSVIKPNHEVNYSVGYTTNSANFKPIKDMRKIDYDNPTDR